MADKESLFKSTAITGGVTFISRATGYVRDAVIFIIFGASGSTDAFFVAFRIPNFLRRLVAEGAFSQTFVPVLSEYKSQRRPEELKNLINHVAGVLLGVLLILTTIGILIAPLLVMLFAPGFIDDQTRFSQTADMLRITFPYVFFISLTTLAAGILNTLGKFGVPAFTPTLLNLSMIAATVWLAPRMETPIYALAWGVFIAGVVQLAFQLPFLWKLKLLPIPKLSGAKDGVKKIVRIMLPALFGSSVVQINLLINTLIASFLVVSSISWLYISDRFVELPLAIFGVAIATVILPKLSSHFVTNNQQGFAETLDWGLRFAVLIALPAMVGLIVLSGPILTSLMQYREFSAHDTQMSQLSLITYGLGLPAFILIKILAPGFYSRQDTKTPVRIGIIAMLVNIVLNLVFLVIWKKLNLPGPHAGLALATSFAGYVNAVLLYKNLKQDAHVKAQSNWITFLFKVACAVIVLCLALWFITPDLDIWSAWSSTKRIATLLGLIVGGALIYITALRICGVRLQQFMLK